MFQYGDGCHVMLIMGPILPKRRFSDVYDACQAASDGNPAAASRNGSSSNRMSCTVTVIKRGGENRQNKAHNLSLSHLLSQDFTRILSPFFCLGAGTASWPPLFVFQPKPRLIMRVSVRSPLMNRYDKTPGVWSHIPDESSGVWIRCEIVLISGVSHIFPFFNRLPLDNRRLSGRISRCDIFWSRWMQHWTIS